MVYFFYNCALSAAFIVFLPLLPIFYLLGKKFHEGLAERFAVYGKAKTAALGGAGRVWIHAASVGEVRSAAHLAQELKRRAPARKIVVSTFTATGNRIARKLDFADLVIILPLDLRWVVRRALARIDPAALIIIETEIWPNLLREAYLKGVPVLLLSGRLSVRAWRRYSWFAGFFRRVLAHFTAIGMQSNEDRDRIVKLGAPANRVSVVGNLKRAFSEDQRAPVPLMGTALERDPDRCAYWLVVGSSHRGEEEILIDAFTTLKRRFPRLQLVLAPRHPERFAEVEKLLKAAGLQFAKKSEVNGLLDFQTDVMFVDTIGDLQEFYAAGDVAFVGGSLVDAGGHNLLEPARFAKPVLFGPHMTNFRSVAQEMRANGGGIEVRGREELICEMTMLLTDNDKRKSIGKKAYEVAAGDRGVLQRNFDLAARYLP